MSAIPGFRAAKLLRTLLDEAVFARDDLAAELVVSPSVLARFVAGTEAMPLDRQLYLAVLVIQKVPKHARRGHQLRGQVIAAIAYEQGVTKQHLSAPPESHRTF